MKYPFVFASLFTVLFPACSPKEKAVTVTVSNPLAEPVHEAVYEIKDAAFMQSIAAIPRDSIVFFDKDREIPGQVIEGNAGIRSVLIQTDFEANEKKTLRAMKGSPSAFPPKTRAEISVKEGGEWKWVTKKNGNGQYEYSGGQWKNVPSLWVDEKHTDHSFDIRYEGPGWESDKIGFRFYLDWRNANDIFGKKTGELVLQQVGLDGFDSYHEPADWGMDILKVGESLGIGTIAHWSGSRANRVAVTDSIYSEVTCSGVLESKITTRYYGWEYEGGKTDLESELSIRAGSYLTKAHLKTTVPMDNLCTGIIKMKDTDLLHGTEGSWEYLATFGKQSLADDHMGLVIFFKTANKITITEDQLSQVVVLKPEGTELTYYFGGVWEQDASRIATPEDFEQFLRRQLALMER